MGFPHLAGELLVEAAEKVGGIIARAMGCRLAPLRSLAEADGAGANRDRTYGSETGAAPPAPRAPRAAKAQLTNKQNYIIAIL